MSSDEEMEAFEITDYDVENEFNPNRKRRKFTREDAIYGVWAQRDDDDDGRGFRSYHGKKGASSAASDYSRPMQFVGRASAEGEDEESDASSDGGRKDTILLERLKEEEEEEEAKELKREVPENFVSGKKAGFLQTVAEKKKRKAVAPTAKPVKQLDKEFGAWEKHTSGFGLKLLQKMGYVPGQGLGKEGAGIVKPIQAFKRRGREALAYFGSEQKHEEYRDKNERRGRRKKGEAADVEDEEEEESHWKVLPKEKGEKKKIKYVYKTVEDILESGVKKTRRGKSQADLKIIDMTGPEQRVLSGYDQLHTEPLQSSETEKYREKVYLPELLHNLNLLVDLAETEILDTSRRLQYEQDQAITCRQEKRRVEEEIARHDGEIAKLEDVLKIVESCKDRLKPGCENRLTLVEGIDLFKKFKSDYPKECKMYGLTQLCESFAFPLMKTYLSQWSPLLTPTFGIDVFSTWRDILVDELGEERGEARQMNMYEKMLWKVWMPKIRIAISGWVCRNCDSLIEFIDEWIPLLPRWITSNIVDQLVLPRLQEEVDRWSPTTDIVPVHSWIHPWLPLLGQRLEIVYPIIRQKLASALTAWHPSDLSAKMILKPWVNVFSAGSMDVFLLNNIIPKLALCLNEFIINPKQQDIEPFQWVMAWQEMISEHRFAQLLERHFFPKWTQVLCSWLSNDPNYDEVTKWYIGWKSMISQSLLNHPVIKEHFGNALNIMNRAVAPGGKSQPSGTSTSLPYFTSIERKRAAEAAAEKRAAYLQAGVPQAASTEGLRFIDLVQKKAEDAGILFMPVPGKKHDGKTVYTFGAQTIYIDRNVLFVHSPSGKSGWVPISLDNLLEMSKGRI